VLSLPIYESLPARDGAAGGGGDSRPGTAGPPAGGPRMLSPARKLKWREVLPRVLADFLTVHVPACCWRWLSPSPTSTARGHGGAAQPAYRRIPSLLCDFLLGALAHLSGGLPAQRLLYAVARLRGQAEGSG
jgi:hypothetical protein